MFTSNSYVRLRSSTWAAALLFLTLGLVPAMLLLYCLGRPQENLGKSEGNTDSCRDSIESTLYPASVEEMHTGMSCTDSQFNNSINQHSLFDPQ